MSRLTQLKQYASDVSAKAKELAKSDEAKALAKESGEIVKDGLKSDIAKSAIGGAAAGAVVGSVVPIVGTAIGAQVGAVMGLYKGITK